MKVFLGLVDIASIPSGLKKGFARLGVETLSAVTTRMSAIVDNALDDCVEDHVPAAVRGKQEETAQRKAQLYFQHHFREIWLQALAECDIFFFVWNTFSPDQSDLAELRRRGKKIVVQYVGSEIRCKQPFEQEYAHYGMACPDYGLSGSPAELEAKLRFLRRGERYADLVINFADQAQLALRPFLTNPYFCLDLGEFPHNDRQRETGPVVVHAPSNRAFKGTPQILAAFERLKQEGVKFTPRLIENLPHREAIGVYADADIVVGELYGQGGGMLAREALAVGTIMVSALHPQYPSRLPGECPIVHADPASIYAVLRELLLDFPKRQALARRGRSYVEEYCDCRKNAERMLAALEGGTPEGWVQTPEFFRKHYRPESPEALAICNRYTEEVKGCDWYARTVEPGERDGLRF